jgi:hypothetical protein
VNFALTYFGREVRVRDLDRAAVQANRRLIV